MKNFMNENDLLVAEIKGISYSEKLISLHIRNDKFGKLGKGLLLEVNNCLIGKMKSHFWEHKGIQFIFGINGFIWISTSDEEFTPEYLENMAKFRNLIEILNESYVSIVPEFLFELHSLTSGYKALDLLVSENRTKLIEQIKQSIIMSKHN